MTQHLGNFVKTSRFRAGRLLDLFDNQLEKEKEKRGNQQRARQEILAETTTGIKDVVKCKDSMASSTSKYQVIPSHGNPPMRRTLFLGYLFKYCSVKHQTFQQVSEKTFQQTYSHQKTT